jgi:CelD/BcsL family acetyltransferase involved in cellulose biosynthesis
VGAPSASTLSVDTGVALQVQSQWGNVDLVDELAEEWRPLCAGGPCAEPFFRPEWIAYAIRAFGAGERVLLLTVRSGSRLRAVLPLLEKTSRASRLLGPQLRSASLIPRFEFVHDGGPDFPQVVAAAWQHLQEIPGWSAIELLNVPEGGTGEQLAAVARENGFPTCRHEYANSPYIDLTQNRPGNDFSRFGLSSRFRYHLRQGWRELSKRGTLSLRRAETIDQQALEQFYRLEQSGWKGRAGSAILCRPDLRRFYDGLVQGAQQFGYLSMYFLDLAGTTIAAHLAFTYAGRYSPIKVAYDESFGPYGPGHLIIARVLEDCVARGLSRFDCLGEWTDAKAKWTTQVRPHVSCYIFRNNAAGRVLCAQTQLRHRLRYNLRKLAGAARARVGALKSWRIRRAGGNGATQKQPPAKVKE